MKRKTLINHLSKAINYLSPGNSPAFADKEREQFINFIIKNGLFEKLLIKINNDPEWQELAKTNLVQYFVDVPQRYLSQSELAVLPIIEILKCEQGTVPVIKVISSKSLF